jgi:hypothetical protein
MRLNSFTVEGYKNLTAPVTFGPLGDLNSLHGPNNAGKSNLIQAIDLFFGLLALGNQVSKDQFVTLDAGEQVPGHPFSEIFTAGSPNTIRLQAEISLPEQELRDFNLEPEAPTDPCEITLELMPVASGGQLRVTQFQLGKVDVAKDSSGPLGFAESLRAFIAGTFFLQSEETTRPFVLVDPYQRSGEAGSERGLVPQRLRDALFDARQSQDRARRARWTLFTQLMRELGPELGPGEFDTAFERSTSRADLVYDSGQVTLSIDRLGAGVQRMAALVGSLVLVRGTLVAVCEPELGLTPSAQQRLQCALGSLLAATGGAGQLFFTTHSPILGGGEHTFAVAVVEGTPTLEQRPCEGAGVLPPLADLPAASGAAPGDLDALIGLVDQLAELEPEELVGAAQAPVRGPRTKATTPAPTPVDEPAAAPAGTPPWKWQPDKK